MDLPILRILQALIKLKEKACVHFYYKIERMKEKAAGFQLKRGKIFYKVFFQSSRLQDVLFSGLQLILIFDLLYAFAIASQPLHYT